MKNSFLICSAFLLIICSSCQKDSSLPGLNDDFELTQNGMPSNWESFGSNGYKISLDSSVVQNGNYSVSIEFTEGKPNYHAWSYVLPDNYDGKTITLSGYIKTENVTDGFAGLLVRIDPGIGIDNMSEYEIAGTTDWTKYEITLDLNPEETEQIIIGGLLAGKGKMWLDNLEVFIDKPGASPVKPEEKKNFPADKDSEFDEGSGISNIPIDDAQVNNLKTLGLVWGFLKYYHPVIAEGKYNWDYELFRFLPKYLNARDTVQRNGLLINWIKDIGEFDSGNALILNSEDVKIEPDLSWISSSNFSNELVTLLTEVKNADRPWKHYYIGIDPNIGNPQFKNEDAYAKMNYPDAGFRLLALYRYWNIIQYYFPYKHLIEEDWKNILEDYIPKFANAKNETTYTLAALELIGQIHDTHANIWGDNKILNNYRGRRYAAPELLFAEGKPVITGFHDESLGNDSGLSIGDIVLAINDKPTEDIVKSKLKYYPASNYPTKLRDIGIDLMRTNDSSIVVTFKRNNKTQKKMVKTYSSEEMSLSYRFYAQDTSFKMITNDIAYLNNGTLKAEDLPVVWDKIKNTKGLIIDNRNYPSHFPIMDLSNYLMPTSTPFVKFTNSSLEHPGLFTYTETSEVGLDNKDYYLGKVIILVNEVSQSSSEYHAMAYRAHPNAKVIGSTTAGADGNVSLFYLPGNIYTMISGIGVYYPDGTETQRVGIIPDIECKPTIKGIREGKDEVLEKAIQVIRE